MSSNLVQMIANILDELLKSLNDNSQFITSQIDQKGKDISEAPGRMQSRYDSSKQELGYMADSLNKRLLVIRGEIAALEKFRRENKQLTVTHCEIGIGSLFGLRDGEGEKEFYLILPVGGGTSFPSNEFGEITVISPDSPLAKAVIGKKNGDEMQFGTNKMKLLTMEGNENG